MSLLTLNRAFDDPNILLEPLVISGNLGGSPFSHLRAGRHLILHLRRNSNRFTLTGERKLLGFVSEVYSYIVLSNSITPSDMDCNRTVVHDPFLRSLDDLREFGAFGVMFNGVHKLFELIPHLSRLARNQGSQLSMGDNLDQNIYGTYHQPMIRIDYLGTLAREQPETKMLSAHSTFLDFFRIALLAFLETTIPPISRNDSMRLHHLQPYLDLALSHLPRVVLSTYSCISMWPIMVIGSCLVKDEQRELITNILSNNHYLMRNTAQGSDLLRLLWNDPDEYFIGPHGLGLLMQKRGLNYGVI
ncbi:hypothetical protein PENCOP_c006G00201 [Penicillium coprophilum]|uniref:Uncharacterized protein n=1 Tax=Penicillium coprophilum TaxID=36646 RepID=A0A1V6UPB1_9EURO|nr:hypothetical protein PENCOP_c006G00201 [Penicillium coprophilum]